MTWTKSAIRAARKADLVAILSNRGYLLQPLKNGNFRIRPDSKRPAAPAGCLVKQNYWSWPERAMAGNTIDFLVHLEAMSFHQAMQVIAASPTMTPPDNIYGKSVRLTRISCDNSPA
jgi:hypothetical protein